MRDRTPLTASLLFSFCWLPAKYAQRRIGLQCRTLLYGALLASTSLYPCKATGVNLRYGYLASDLSPAHRYGSTYKALDLFCGGPGEYSRVSRGPVDQISHQAKSDKIESSSASRRALCWFSEKLSPVETIKDRNGKGFLLLHSQECDRSENWVHGLDGPHVCGHERSNAARESYGGLADGSIRKLSREVSNVVEIPPGTPRESKVFPVSDIQQLTRPESTGSNRVDPSLSGKAVASLRISRHKKRIVYKLEDDFGSENRTTESKNGAPRYVKITALQEAIGGWFEEDGGASVFELPHADIDISYDGNKWFHLVGSKCIKDYQRLIVAQPIDGLTSSR